MRHVISPVEVVIDEHFPVAIQRVRSALEKMQPANTQWLNPPNQSAKKISERRGIRIEIDEDKLLPRTGLNGNEPVPRVIEAAHALKFRSTLERAVEPVAPAVVGTTKNTGSTLGFGDDRCSMVSAQVVERAKPHI